MQSGFVLLENSMMMGQQGQEEKAAEREEFHREAEREFAVLRGASVGFRRNTAQNEVYVVETNEWLR